MRKEECGAGGPCHMQTGIVLLMLFFLSLYIHCTFDKKATQ